MLNQQMIANIRESGLVQGAAEAVNRDRILREEMGFRVADRAEYAVIASCYLPFMAPQDTKAFGNLLRHFKLDYSLLPREYCCGNLQYREALGDKSGEDMKQADLLGREFVEENLRQVRQLGASKIVTYCVGCDLTYSRFKEAIPEEILWYPTLFARLFRGGKLELEADYYAGCHYFYHRINSRLPDLDSPLAILNGIEGLKLNHLNHRLCCTRPKQMEALINSIKNKTIITPCYGCALYLQQALKDRGDYRVAMLAEVTWAAVSGQSL